MGRIALKDKTNISGIARQACINVAKDLAKELDKAAREAFEMFYKDYVPSKRKNRNMPKEWLTGQPNGSPVSYRRYYENFLFKVHRGITNYKNKDVYIAKVKFDTSLMDEVYKSLNGKTFPAETIFGYVYEGYHGSPLGVDAPQYIPKRMSPTPKAYIEEKRGELEKQVYDRINKEVDKLMNS